MFQKLKCLIIPIGVLGSEWNGNLLVCIGHVWLTNLYNIIYDIMNPIQLTRTWK